MRQHAAARPALARLAAVVVLAVLAPAGVTMGTASAARAASPARAAAGPAVAGPVSSRTVLLINGDRVTVTPGASGLRVATARASAGGLNGALVKLGLAGHAYEIPADGLPYLNRGLSPGLFDLGALQRAESGGRLPVEVSYRGRLPALPGVTITGSGGGIARGYLTAASAAVFGAALARQAAADHARGGYGRDGMFAGGVSIGLPGAAAAPARPGFAMHTLTVTGTDLAGKPDTGDPVMVFSVDSLLRFGDPVETFSLFDNGTARFSVPAGHYIAIGLFVDFSGQGVSALRTVVLPQFTVAGNATAAVDERTATAKAQIVTPRPSVLQDLTMSIQRVMADGSHLYFGTDAGTLPLFTNLTTRPVTVGSLRTITTAYLTSPARASPPYEYDLAFAGPSGVVGPEHYVVTPASVATVRAAFYRDQPSTGGWAPLSAFRFQLQLRGLVILATNIYPLPLPRAEVQYLSAGRSLYWLVSYEESVGTAEGGQFDAARTFSPGEVTAVNWNAYPLHPTPDVSVLGTRDPVATIPSAGRAGDTLWLDITPFGDNTPGHTGTGFFDGFPGNPEMITGRYELDQNGKKIASGDAVQASGGLANLVLRTVLSPLAARIRFVLTASRTGPLYRLSVASQTVWTWRSARHPGARLPAGWICADFTSSCAVEPMMTLLYQVRGLAVNGSAPAGAQLIGVTVGHLQLARAAAVTGMTAQVSVDDGRTWRPATVTPACGGRFNVTFTAPPGAQVTLRVHAADATGGQITETITRAYRTAA